MAIRFRRSGTNWEGRRWTLVPCLVKLAEQIEALHPEKSPADGTVASKTHDANSPNSDHRPFPYKGPGEVRALDAGEVTEDDAFKIAEAIRMSRDPRVKYVLHESRMFSSYPMGPYQSFTWRPYYGPAHEQHMHISTEDEADNDVRPWAIQLGGTPVPTPTDGNWAKPGDPVIGVKDMKAVHAWQGSDVLTVKDIDYVAQDAAEVDWRAKFHVTKLLNVIMKG